MRTLTRSVALAIWAALVVLVGYDPWPSHTHAQCAHDAAPWHPPACGHEHGDDGPPWVKAFLAAHGAAPEVRWATGALSTGPHENHEKHPGFKGFHAPSGFVSFNRREPAELYVVMHASSSPADRQSPVHSSVLFVRDASGNVTFRQGWQKLGTVKLDTACQAPRLPTCPTPETDNGQRPIVLAPGDAGLAGGRSQETWYGDSSFDVSWGISDATTKLTPGEVLSYNPADWFPTGQRGLTRTLEVTVPVTAQTARGWQVRDQFGLEVLSVSATPAPNDYSGLSGLSHPACGQPITFPGGSDTRRCLPQYVAPTSDGVVTAGGARKTYPVPAGGVVLPN